VPQVAVRQQSSSAQTEAARLSAGMAPVTKDFLDLVRSRAYPGVLIMGLDNRIVYSNQEGLGFFVDPENVPAEVIGLCDKVKAGHEPQSCCGLLRQQDGVPYSLRAFPIGGPENGHGSTHVMVLIEKVIEKHDINYKRAKSEFGLSDREIEVVALLAHGLANKEIGSKLFVSEHTVKDHIKNIMRKMSASSRSEIIAILK